MNWVHCNIDEDEDEENGFEHEREVIQESADIFDVFHNIAHRSSTLTSYLLTYHKS